MARFSKPPNDADKQFRLLECFCVQCRRFFLPLFVLLALLVSASFQRSIDVSSAVTIRTPRNEQVLSKNNETFVIYNKESKKLYESMPRWMTAYVDLHQSRIIRSDDGSLHYEPDKPYLQWQCAHKGSCGGLGDRLRGIVMSLYISIAMNRTFIVRDYTITNLTDYLEPSLIHWNLSTESLPYGHDVSSIDNYKHPYLLRPCKQQHHDSLLGITFENNLMTPREEMETNECFTEYWNRFGGRQKNDYSLFYIGFWTLFRFSKLVEDRADHLRQSAGMAKDAPYVGVHIRTGKGANWEDPIRHGSNEDIRKFGDCAAKLQTGMKERYASSSSSKTTTLPEIYVAADNSDAKQQLSSMNKHAKFVPDMQVLHIDRSREEEIDNVDQAYLDVWAELKILIDSTCLVMSKSGFSYVAQELSHEQPRCAVMFDDCSDEAVAKALSGLKT